MSLSALGLKVNSSSLTSTLPQRSTCTRTKPLTIRTPAFRSTKLAPALTALNCSSPFAIIVTIPVPSPITAEHIGVWPSIGSVDTTFTMRLSPFESGSMADTSLNVAFFFSIGSCTPAFALPFPFPLPPAFALAGIWGLIHAPSFRAEATSALTTSCVCSVSFGQDSSGSPPRTSSENFSTSRVCCTHPLTVPVLTTSWGKVRPLSARVSLETAKEASELLFGTTKSSTRSTHFCPTTSPDCLNACLKEQSKVAVRPPGNLSRHVQNRGTPSEVSSKNWQHTDSGSS
mmetsp:Transcript_19265/g.54413  ORF Transcript_19265/g.54413 Transcript_19265/m.54413 type:complete len:287 (+) Transcript_19265:138-998(+)